MGHCVGDAGTAGEHHSRGGKETSASPLATNILDTITHPIQAIRVFFADTTESRLGDLSVHLDSLVSSLEDADLADVVLDMTRAEQTLQLAQGTGARLINQSLLSFLR